MDIIVMIRQEVRTAILGRQRDHECTGYIMKGRSTKLAREEEGGSL